MGVEWWFLYINREYNGTLDALRVCRRLPRRWVTMAHDSKRTSVWVDAMRDWKRNHDSMALAHTAHNQLCDPPLLVTRPWWWSSTIDHHRHHRHFYTFLGRSLSLSLLVGWCWIRVIRIPHRHCHCREWVVNTKYIYTLDSFIHSFIPRHGRSEQDTARPRWRQRRDITQQWKQQQQQQQEKAKEQTSTWSTAKRQRCHSVIIIISTTTTTWTSVGTHTQSDTAQHSRTKCRTNDPDDRTPSQSGNNHDSKQQQ